ncbi:HAD family hydrolase [Phenylobacterium montanum]|uniref:HAD family hydrolase n=1 Tax=Phenylobacterium montanum TaxID=2823693 RepID=A0A975IV63_9CAUL|nr:HAD family hydrolase [Caulobacter sp. S6]QUD88667.1 HAD family hydrolase [Caulobacter sp. S6]
MPITAVVFDVGETLVDETRHWGEWADWMGVPHLTLFAALGAVIARGQHHRQVFQLLRPGFDVEAAEASRLAAGWRYRFLPGDFYPDALPCLAALRAGGLRIGLAGNQPEAAEEALHEAGVQADFIASSARWGVEKPSPAFFDKVIEAAGRPAGEIAYVGDRLDNDVLPARAAGLAAVFLRRGPWGLLHALGPEAAQADIQLESLDGLAEILAQAPSTRRGVR